MIFVVFRFKLFYVTQQTCIDKSKQLNKKGNKLWSYGSYLKSKVASITSSVIAVEFDQYTED